MRIHKFITYFVKLLLSTRCRGASLLYMAAEEMFGKRVIVTVHGECEITVSYTHLTLPTKLEV